MFNTDDHQYSVFTDDLRPRKWETRHLTSAMYVECVRAAPLYILHWYSRDREGTKASV